MALKTNVFHTGDEHFSAEDKRIENVFELQPHTHTHTHTHTQTPATSKQILCRDDCYSQVLTSENGRYHAFLITSG